MMKVRFAPSPTGNLHIGGARTALFNWLFAKSKDAKFVLRIEDTDAKRSKKEYLDEILFSLKWLGFEWDELYHQSERFAIYREHAEKLLAQGKAYEAEKMIIEAADEGGEEDTEGEPCASEPAAGGGRAIIFKVPQEKVMVTDLIRGEIEFDTSVIKDQVLIKSDGTPSYNFACVVDDALMGITHVIRGDDHISNTPKQILLYNAFGFTVPQFAHLPLILSKEGGRLSKRKGATAISEYREMGYLPEALVNFLLLLGWSPGANREILPIQEAIKLFTIKHINKTAAVLDMDKLNWINNQYLKNADPDKLTAEVIPLLTDAGLIAKEGYDRAFIRSLVVLFRERLTLLKDFPKFVDFFFVPDEQLQIDPEAQEKYLSRDFSREFSLFAGRLGALEKFDIPEIEKCFREMVAELQVPVKELIHPVRVALTGKTVGPGLFDVIYYLGKQRTERRLLRWVKKEPA
jgi:glutamyl-tRNA synthetase